MAREIEEDFLMSDSCPLLVNLLSYRPTFTGLSRYTERFLESWQVSTGLSMPLQLRVNASGKGELSFDQDLPPRQNSRYMRLLQNNGLVQHGVQVRSFLAKSNPDIIYSPYTDLLLAAKNRLQVITCHDLTPLYFPSSCRAYWRSRIWLPRHLHQATKVIAISQSVADLLIKNKLPARRITVIPNGIEFVEDPITHPASFDFLILARHALNKNLSLALKGFAKFLALQPEWPGHLFIVGAMGIETKSLHRLESELSLQGRVCWLPYLDKSSLEKRFRESFCLISTSLMEGFDYPLLEAQVRGLPTLASRIPVHEELYSEVSLLFDLHDGGVNLAVHLQQLALDNRLWQQLSQVGLTQSQKFNLEHQTRSIADLLAMTGDHPSH